jgi:hypothetical protein
MKITKEMMTGLTDLGKERKKYNYVEVAGKEERKEKTYIDYPSFCVVGKEELLNTPDGEFYAVVRLEKKGFSKREDWDDPEKMITEVTFDVKEIKALTAPDEKPSFMEKPVLDFSSLAGEEDED